MFERVAAKQEEEIAESEIGFGHGSYEGWKIVIGQASCLSMFTKIGMLSKELRHLTNSAITHLILHDFSSYDFIKAKQFLNAYRHTEHYKLLKRKFNECYSEMTSEEKICFILTRDGRGINQANLSEGIAETLCYAKAQQFKPATVKHLRSIKDALASIEALQHCECPSLKEALQRFKFFKRKFNSGLPTLINLSGIDFKSMDFSFLNLSGYDFTGADLTDVKFHETLLHYTCFYQANLMNAQFIKVELNKVQFFEGEFYSLKCLEKEAIALFEQLCSNTQTAPDTLLIAIAKEVLKCLAAIRVDENKKQDFIQDLVFKLDKRSFIDRLKKKMAAHVEVLDSYKNTKENPCFAFLQ